FDLVALLFVVGEVEPEETRVECLARWWTTFFSAASAIEPSMTTATMATSSMFSVLRIIELPPEKTSSPCSTIAHRFPVCEPVLASESVGAHVSGFQLEQLRIADPVLESTLWNEF